MVVSHLTIHRALIALAFFASVFTPLKLNAQQPYLASASAVPTQPPSLTSADYIRLMEIANEERRQAKERASGLSFPQPQPQQVSQQFSQSTAEFNAYGQPPVVANFPQSQPPALTLGAPGITAPAPETSGIIGSGISESAIQMNPQGYAPDGLSIPQTQPFQDLPYSGVQGPIVGSVNEPSGSMNGASPSSSGRPSKGFYLASELLWLHAHGDSGYSFSDAGSMGSRGVDLSGRYTIGRVFDDLERIEFVYTGPYQWNRQLTATGSHDILLNDNNVVPSLLRGFNNATLQSQSQVTSYSSYELNKQWCADDLSSIFLGLKVIDASERLQFASQTSLGAGNMSLSNQNLLAGLQVGGLMFRPLSQRLSVGLGGRAGLMLNWARGRMSFEDLGATIVNNRDDKTRAAGLLQLSTVARYYVTSRIALLAKYEGWYIPGVATNSEQGIVTIAAGTPYRIRTNDALFLYGTVLGVEASF